MKNPNVTNDKVVTGTVKTEEQYQREVEQFVNQVKALDVHIPGWVLPENNFSYKAAYLQVKNDKDLSGASAAVRTKAIKTLMNKYALSMQQKVQAEVSNNLKKKLEGAKQHDCECGEVLIITKDSAEEEKYPCPKEDCPKVHNLDFDSLKDYVPDEETQKVLEQTNRRF